MKRLAYQPLVINRLFEAQPSRNEADGASEALTGLAEFPEHGGPIRGEGHEAVCRPLREGVRKVLEYWTTVQSAGARQMFRHHDAIDRHLRHEGEDRASFHVKAVLSIERLTIHG